jgi:hypothetical protein
MKVIVKRGRGVIVSNPDNWSGIKIDLENCVDLQILDCRIRLLKGLSGDQWAKKWLDESPRRPAKILTVIPCRTSVKESGMSVESLGKAFKASCNPRKIGLGAKQRRLTNIL